MKIIADKDGKEAIEVLVDAYLKENGLRAVDGVLGVLRCIEDYIEPPKEETLDT